MLGLEQWPGFALVPADVRDAGQLRRALAGANSVVHLAAVVGEPACVGRKSDARAVNVGGTTALLDALRTIAVERLILVSTCSNYGVSDPTMLADEDSPLHPRGIYARSKVDAELAALALFTNSGSRNDISAIRRRHTGAGEPENGQGVRCRAARGG